MGTRGRFYCLLVLRVGYSYDIHNNLTGLTQTVNGVERISSYTYDDDNRVTSVTADGVTVEYTYDALGRVSQQATKQGETTVLTESFTYTTVNGNTSAQIATYTTVTAAGSTTYTYTYDGNGNILSVSDGTNTTSYVYDKQNQLIRENNQEGGFTHTWQYDNAGNILTRTEYAYTTEALGTPTDTVQYTYADESWGDLLTAYDGAAITYDGIGNPNALDGWSFTWEHGRELATMSNGTTTWTNTYNADGLRTKRTNGSTTYSYVYTGSSLLSMTVGSNTLYFNYDAAGTPLTVTYNGTTYYYATNLQGDVVAILDSTGTTVVSYTYDAWGNPISTTGSLASTLGQHNPLRYRGYVYDTETDLYYLQSRYYNAKLGRFINADGYTSTNQGFSGNNTFVYCGNSPITFSDYGGNRYCAATTVAGETSDDRSMACEFQKEIIREKRIKDYGAATAYVPNSDTDTNCVGYALGVDGWLYVGDNNSPSFCLFTTVLMTIITSISNGHGIRIISSYDSPISSDEYRIALRIGESDYHFMVQHNDGSWSHKPGVCPSRLVTGDDPRAMSWDRPEINERLFYYTGKVEETNVVPNYYDSYTVFFAVRK